MRVRIDVPALLLCSLLVGSLLASAEARADPLGRGIEALERGELERAESSLREAVRLAPGDADAHYFLGQLLSERRQLEAAARSFERASALAPDFAQAHLYAGISRYELDQGARALSHFERAQALAPESPEAALFLGVLAEERGDSGAARDFYARAARLDPGGPSGDRATSRAARLAQPRTRPKPAGNAPRPRAFASSLGASLGAGIEYDSSVGTLDVDSNSDEGDGSGVFEAGFWLRPPANRLAGNQLTLSYDILQSLHFELDDFDLRVHLLRGAIERELDERIALRMVYGYTHSVLGEDRIFGAHALEPSARLKLVEWASLRVGYGFRYFDYTRNHRIAGPLDDRDAARHSLRLDLRLTLPRTLGRVTARYRLARNDASSNAFDYDGHEFALAWARELDAFFESAPARPRVEVSYDHARRDYDDGLRRDRRNTPGVRLAVPLVGPVEAQLGYAIEVSKSTLASVDFVSHRLGLLFAAEF